MTTKDKIKALIGADKQIAMVIGALPHLYECEDKQENVDTLAEASNTIHEVINALCDELPEHIAASGKMMNEGPSVILCAKEETK